MHWKVIFFAAVTEIKDKLTVKMNRVIHNCSGFAFLPQHQRLYVLIMGCRCENVDLVQLVASFINPSLSCTHPHVKMLQMTPVSNTDFAILQIIRVAGALSLFCFAISVPKDT